MTKVIIYGAQEKTTNKKKIEFVSVLRGSGKFSNDIDSSDQPSNWDEVVYLARFPQLEMDLIFCKDYSDPYCDTVYLGHFNDGVV